MSVSSFWEALRGFCAHRVGLPSFSVLTDSTTGAGETSNLTSRPPPPLSKSFHTRPLLPQTKIQIQIFLFCFPSFFVCLVLVPLSCSGELKEELFMKQPEWERAYASVWELALFRSFPALSQYILCSPLSLFYFLPNSRRKLIVKGNETILKEQERRIHQVLAVVGSLQAPLSFNLAARLRTLQSASACVGSSYSIDLCTFGSNPKWKEHFLCFCLHSSSGMI